MRAPKTKFEDVRAILEEELGQSLETVFSEFDQEPIASASLGQVHRARLISTGETVAVKVQHRWIREQVPGDLRIVKLGAQIAAKIFPDFKYAWLADEFQTRLPLEIDFRLEALNCHRCSKIFANDKRVAVPRIYDQFTRERCLVMSFEQGTPVTHVRRLHSEGINLRELAKLISESFVKMIFEEGFVHADPHPGNLMVRRAPNGTPQLVILDHGIYTEMSEPTRISYCKLWRGILSQDELAIKEASAELGADFYQLFTAMLVNRTYEDVMESGKRVSMKARLGDQNT